YNQDPVEPLMFEGPLTAVKTQLGNNPTYLQDLIRTFLLENNHRVTLVLEPDTDLQQQEEAAEKERLAAVKAKLNDNDIESLIKRTAELRAIQSAPDDPAELAKIPRLTLDDLDKEVKTTPIEVTRQDGATILFHDLFTNGIVYLEVGFNVHALPQELLPYLKLFGRSLTGIGTESQDYVKLSQRIGRKTGGIYPTSSISNKRDADDTAAWFFLRGKSTMEQTSDMLAIMKDVLLTVKLDNQERFRQMVLESKAQVEAGLIPSGHSVVNTRLGSLFSEAGWASEQTGGISYLFFLRELAEAVAHDWPSVLTKLEEVRRILINRNGMICNVTLDADNWAVFAPQLRKFVAAMSAHDAPSVVWEWEKTAVSEGLTIPAQVNYVGKGTNIFKLGYQRHGSISVIKNYLNTSYLWEKIRVQGGAYGAFAVFGSQSGVFSYLSYRDPNLLGTLENYDNTSHFLRNGIQEDELGKSIIGAISSMDSYQLPDAKGFGSMIRYLTNITDEYRQQVRDEILSTSSADFVAFADALDQVKEHGLVVVLGSSDAISAANAERGNWLTVTKAL
ncbi:MAG: peptidase M16, partial [Anaerolineales bacterium]|nr:peptidase M16 [Anaerolineales bacterium]